MASFADVATRTAEEEKALQTGDDVLKSLETDLKASEEILEKAEARYHAARQRVEKELGKKDLPSSFEEATGDQLQSDLVEEKALAAAEEVKEKAVTQARGDKNSKVVPEKVLSCQKWLQKRASDNRAREADRRARQLQRRQARDGKHASADVPPEDDAAGGADAGRERAGSGDLPAGRERAGSGDSIASDGASKDEIERGAKSIASRLKSISERPDSYDKRASTLKVLTCGRPGFYSFNLCDVVLDLQERGVLDDAVATEMLNLLADEETPASSEPKPPEEWLAHAKKMSQFKRLDDAPFKEVEAMYLGRLDGRKLQAAEAELEAAESQLEEAVTLASLAHYGLSILEATELPRDHPAQKELEIDEDRVAAQVKEPSMREHKGQKNTSALPEKVVSCQKWLAARGMENRAREAQKKARDLLRSTQRDGKRSENGGYGTA